MVKEQWRFTGAKAGGQRLSQLFRLSEPVLHPRAVSETGQALPKPVL